MSEAPKGKRLRPLWYLGPGGMPIRATSKKVVPVGVTHWAYEGDSEWTPIEKPQEHDNA